MDCIVTWASHRMDRRIREISGDGPEIQSLIADLKVIWKEGFHDTEEYISFFFENRYIPQDTVIASVGKQVAGVAYLLSAKVISGGEEIPAFLGYAICVSKKYSGQGIGDKIHTFISQFCDQNHYIYLLHPANERLEAYYKRIGLKSAGDIKKVTFPCRTKAASPGFTLENINPKEYCRFRDRFFTRDGYLKWDEAAIRYAILENSFCGGFCHKIICPSGTYAVLGRITEDKLILTEAIVPDDLLPDILQQLAAHLGAGEVTVFLPCDSAVEGEIVPWIMGFKEQRLQGGYCNLLLN